MTTFVCPACGATVLSLSLKTPRAPYCSCNPKAPFRMQNQLVRRIVAGTIRRMARGAKP